MKKIVSGVLSACIAVSSFTTPALAVTRIMPKTDVSVSESVEDLERIILSIKSRIDISEELTEFSYKYIGNNYESAPYWSLIWRDKEYNSSVNINCDNDENILYYRSNNYDDQRIHPKYLKEELKDKSLELIKKIAPNIANNIQFKEARFNGVYSGSYTYSFERIENGFRMPDNSVNVTLRYDTGDIISASIDWDYNCEIPKEEVKITEQEAKEKVGKNVKMSLQYRNKIEEVDGRKVVKAYLVYVPDKTYVAVDAKTGEVYDAHDEYYKMSELKEESTLASTNMAMDTAGQLTEQEVKKIDEIKGLISKQEAIDFVVNQKDFYIDDNAKAIEARLYQKYDYLNNEDGEYVWDITLYDPRDADYLSVSSYRANISASVDAKTGKIIRFYSNIPGYYDKSSKEWKEVNVKYNSEECQKIFEKFVKKTEPEMFEKVKFDGKQEFGYVLKIVKEENVYGGYTYRYNRVNEGIEYSYNGIYGSVDGVTGKIYSYSTDWTDDITFESPKNAMSKDEAYKSYVSNEGFELVYEINNKHYIDDENELPILERYLLEKEARLVYRTAINPAIISPFTGKQLDYKGEIYENEAKKEYKDIEGFWYERYVKLITDMGITFEGESFLPDKEITEKEFADVLEKIGYYSYKDKEKEKPSDTLTKLDASKIIIDRLDLSKVAELQGIYKLEFNDANKISEKDLGYVALLKALGIVSGDNSGNFNPSNNITRAQAACMVIKLIESGLN